VVLATNQTNRSAALQNGKKQPEDVFVVRTAPKIPNLETPADPALKKGRPYLVGYVGVMGSADGVHFLIEAINHIVNSIGRHDVQFLLMGNGPEFDSLVALRDQYNLQNYVDFPGWALNDYLFKALKTIDIGVTCDPPNAYNHSCTMNKVLEYMVFGKAQVMFDLVESRASAGEAALYVPGESPQRLADGILELLDDPVRREKMGQLGASRLRSELNWERSVAELERAYARALR
jgi:glycosyltransferase involved in cell wall biosynthesis